MATYLSTIKRQNWNLIFSLLDTHAYVCVCSCMYVYMHMCKHMYVCMYVCMKASVQVPGHTCGGQNTTLVLVLTYIAKKKANF